MGLQSFTRLPDTQNHTLQAYNAADELLVKTILPQLTPDKKIGLINDRFGYLTCHFLQYDPTVFIHLKSQQEAIQKNTTVQGLSGEVTWTDLLIDPPQTTFDVIIVHLPKSLSLLDWYCYHLHACCHEKTIVYWGFMTRHFTPAWLSLAGKFFNKVEQGRSEKKARLIRLQQRKKLIPPQSKLVEIKYEGLLYKQYPGVFSQGKVDPATLFLLNTLQFKNNEKVILDWGCGMGIIGGYIRQQNHEADLDSVDDFLPAVASARENLPGSSVFWDYQWPIVDKKYDLIITNPPFHFEYETDMTISLQFFRQSVDKLNPDGRLIIVANRHLNYKSQLDKIFPKVICVNQNEKFIIYECQKQTLSNDDI